MNKVDSIARVARAALAKCIRLLASDIDGEALGAARALARTLKANNLDFHDLAAVVEAPSTALTRVARDRFDDGDSAEIWKVMLAACADRLDRFTPRERQFLETLQHWYGTPTPKQFDWLVALFDRVRRAA